MLGERAGPSSLGLAGFLMMNAPDVGRALEDLVHYLSLHDRGGVATFEVRNGTALLGFTVIEPETQAVDQICDLSMAVARNLMRGLCGPKWVPSQVLLPRKPPADPTPWTRVFQFTGSVQRRPVRTGIPVALARAPGGGRRIRCCTGTSSSRQTRCAATATSRARCGGW